MTSAPLTLSLGHVADLLAIARAIDAPQLARSASASPYFLDLPAYGGSGGTVSAASLNVVASLYFVAEIEGTYVVSVAEELARNRYGLNLTDPGAAEKLEALASAMRSAWVDRDLRNQIFARVFGIGHSDPNLGDAAVNREFEPRFARFAGALVAASRDLAGWGAPAGAAMRATVAAQTLLGNLANRLQGNTLIVTERLSNQLTLSLAALNHPGMTALFMGRTAWDVVRSVLQVDTPDLQGQISRAQTGLRLFSWLARNLAAIEGADAQGVMDAIGTEKQLGGWAEIWLDSAGIARPAPPPHQGYMQ